jgi:hypothetical protein
MFRHAAAGEGDRDGRTRMLAIAAFVTLLALLLRTVFFLAARVDHPIRGDVIQYVVYAWNLVHHATLSSSEPGSAVVVADSFRGPGYPVFLALCMVVARDQPSWQGLAVALQIGVGTAAIPLTMALARQWQPLGWSLAAGALMAVWPHEIVFSSTLLSETLFCVGLLVMILVCCAADRRDSIAAGSAAGVSAACCYLINPVIALFPLIVAGLLWWRGKRRSASALAAVFLLVFGAWSIRNATLPSSSSMWERAADNLVEGSWPQYHAAYNSRFANEISRAIMQNIAAEEHLMATDPRAGAAAVFERFAMDPGYYVGWYLLKKPYALWSWDVRIGWGDVYFLETHESPFDRYPALRILHGACRILNPVLFAFALIAALFYVGRVAASRQAPTPAASVVALLFLYLTLVHTVFQADPRYAVAYRPFEMALATAGGACLAAWASRALARMRRGVAA